jgi:hypothetical protein
VKPWPTVSLGELLRLERRPVKVEPEKLYQEIGIYCFGRGIFHKSAGGVPAGSRVLRSMATILPDSRSQNPCTLRGEWRLHSAQNLAGEAFMSAWMRSTLEDDAPGEVLHLFE